MLCLSPFLITGFVLFRSALSITLTKGTDMSPDTIIAKQINVCRVSDIICWTTSKKLCNSQDNPWGITENKKKHAVTQENLSIGKSVEFLRRSSLWVCSYINSVLKIDRASASGQMITWDIQASGRIKLRQMKWPQLKLKGWITLLVNSIGFDSTIQCLHKWGLHVIDNKWS